MHCQERGSEIIVGDESHIHYYEQGGMAQVIFSSALPPHISCTMNFAIILCLCPQIGGIHHRTVKNNPDGTFDLQELEDKIRIEDDDHFAFTKLILIENTHNRCGGTVVPMKFMKDVRSLPCFVNFRIAWLKTA